MQQTIRREPKTQLAAAIHRLPAASPPADRSPALAQAILERALEYLHGNLELLS